MTSFRGIATRHENKREIFSYVEKKKRNSTDTCHAFTCDSQLESPYSRRTEIFPFVCIVRSLARLIIWREQVSHYTPLCLSPTPKASWLRSVRARLLLRRVGLDTGKKSPSPPLGFQDIRWSRSLFFSGRRLFHCIIFAHRWRARPSPRRGILPSWRQMARSLYVNR